jgi:hypothetical protein
VKAFDKVGASSKEMAADLDSSSNKAERAIGGMNTKIGDAESKFMGAADLADGLASALGINVGPTIEYARAFGDMAGGFTATVGPAMESMAGKLGKLSGVTKIQTMAQTALNTVMRANPIMLAVTALAALTAGFIIAYKKSETFRAIVHGAMDAVRKPIGWVSDKVSELGRSIGDVATDAARTFARIADIITTPYQIAFRAVASLWNNTVGRLSVSIPGFMGFGGISFDVPDIPMLAAGGIARGGMPHIVGERGPELFVPGRTGTVVPNGQFGGPTVIRFDFTGGESALVELMRKAVATRGGNVQAVLGRT